MFTFVQIIKICNKHFVLFGHYFKSLKEYATSNKDFTVLQEFQPPLQNKSFQNLIKS